MSDATPDPTGPDATTHDAVADNLTHLPETGKVRVTSAA